MTIFRTILMIVFSIVSMILTVIILMQEGKNNGLGAIAGAADSYWGKNTIIKIVLKIATVHTSRGIITQYD